MVIKTVDFTIHIRSHEHVHILNNVRAAVPYGRNPAKPIPVNISFMSLYSMIIAKDSSEERPVFTLYTFGIGGEGLCKLVLDFSDVSEWPILENEIDAIIALKGSTPVSVNELRHGNCNQIAEKMSIDTIRQVRETLKDIISLYPQCVTDLVEGISFVSREAYVD